MRIKDCLSRSIDRIYLSNLDKYDTNGLRVTLTSSSKEYSFHVGKLEVPTIKINIVDERLNFFQRLFTKVKVVEHFPTGNMREMIGYNKSFKEVLTNAIHTFIKLKGN